MEYLRFDEKALYTELRKRLEENLKADFKKLKEDILGAVKWDEARELGKVELEFNKTSDRIINTVIANAYIIADSFGTGTKSILDDSEYAEYRKSEYWNELRKGKRIVGRKEGEYTNFFGESAKSTGNFAGVPVNVEEIIASASIPDAWKELFYKNLPNTISKTVNSIDYSKYFTFR